MFFNSSKHPDTYVTCEEEKATPKRWFITNTMPQFKAPSKYKIEVTCGRPHDEAWGSILIKAISTIDGTLIVDGVSNVVNKIL